ncbi:MAG TPA: glycosyl hydrolase family 65 protein [Solirubrobacteraceae bacterium]|nr:glycosyl hydrolase family 65 protein [Solirubrobacteraceae bacterium]
MRSAISAAAVIDAPAARRFEAVVVAWEPGGDPLDGGLRERVEAACAAGLDVALVGGGRVEDVDRSLRARPAGPGRLHLVVRRGREIYRVGERAPSPVAFPEPGVEAQRAANRGRHSAELVEPAEVVAVRWLLGDLWRRGVGAADVLLVGLPWAPRARGPVVIDAPLGRDAGDLLAEQVARRRSGEVPAVIGEPGWTLRVSGMEPELERARESLLALGDGRIGTRGTLLGDHPAQRPAVLAAGAYAARGARSRLRAGPLWNRLGVRLRAGAPAERVLDLHAGVLGQELETADGTVRGLLLSSLARPGTVALRAEGPKRALRAAMPLVLRGARHGDGGRVGDDVLRLGTGDRHGAIEAAAWQVVRGHGATGRLERLAAYESGPAPAAGARARRRLAAARAAGFERVLAEHRAAWARRWEDCDIRIAGDEELTLAVRLALFHVMAAVADRGEAAVGARGLSGPAYRGHVFWDSDVYVLPVLAATHPAAARAMLEYRARRLPAARRAARAQGLAGARFPWESAWSGREATPRFLRDAGGRLVEIKTGLHEEHIVGDVAWAAATYADWTGDDAFMERDGARLLIETARYWAARLEPGPGGRAHLRGVIGPDEYHVGVDDNAFTNGLARWNLRRAAALPGAPEQERRAWLALADRLVDGYDPSTRLYEQFAGFHALEPLVIADVAPRRPVAADILLGEERVAGAQVVKQADVLMLHHLLPEDVAPGSLDANLAYYEPRTAHGSSLSPGVHASLLARAGRLGEAADLLRLTARIDLDDVTRTTAGGIHLAAMASVWHALVFGFAGIRPHGRSLALDPHVPPSWGELDIRLRFRGARLGLRLQADGIEVSTDQPVALAPACEAEAVVIEPPGGALACPRPSRAACDAPVAATPRPGGPARRGTRRA